MVVHGQRSDRGAWCSRAQPQEHRRGAPPGPARRPDGALGLGQVLARLRHHLRRGPAPLRRVALRVRAAVPRADGEARGRLDRGALARDLDRAEDDQQESALHRRHRHRDLRLPARALRARRRAALPVARQGDPGAGRRAGGAPPAAASRGPAGAGPGPMVFGERLACADCGISFPEVSPRMFSFNNPYGACPECGGIGTRFEIDPERLVPNANRSLKAGALAPWAGRENAYFKQTLAALAKTYRFSLDEPWAKLKKPVRDVILGGDRDGGFEGVVKLLERRYRETESEDARREIEAFMAERPCPVCEGSRLRRESLGLRIAGKSIADVVRLTIKDAATFFNTLKLGEREAAIARRVLKEIRERLGFLANVGLDYLTLDRPAGTLAGGEGQRIRLATQIGSSLAGVLYILDEPSIGLHQRDNRRLIETLKRLRDLGNTVLVVEHDEETIKSADYVVDLGPGAGERGGHVVAVGTPDEITANPNSLTGRYLARALGIPVRATRRKRRGHAT